jgi:hypothetical protein
VFGEEAPEWPAFEIESSPIASGTRLRVHQTHVTERPFPCVVELDLVGATRTVRVQADFGLDPAGSTLVLDVPFDEPVTRVVVDPDKRLLDFSVPSSIADFATPRWHP